MARPQGVFFFHGSTYYSRVALMSVPRPAGDTATISWFENLFFYAKCFHTLLLLTLSRPAHMHHKFVVIDDALVINGSYNWTKGARYDNREDLTLTNSPQAVQGFKDEFEKLWREFANEQLN